MIGIKECFSYSRTTPIRHHTNRGRIRISTRTMLSATALATINQSGERDDGKEAGGMNQKALDKLSDCEDISLLPLPEEAIILQLLAARYAKNRIYSKCGDVLLATNPYCDISHIQYTDELLLQYSNPRSLELLDKLPPHPWKTAAKAYRNLFIDSSSGGGSSIGIGNGNGNGVENGTDVASPRVSQSIIISGESGSGKSETTKIVLNFLAKIGSFSNANKRTMTLADFRSLDLGRGDVQSCILQTNIILEALGNARTVRNDNSSRFGKLIQLLFSKEGKLEGSCVDTYLLELTRVVQQQETERNFHIFYMILNEKDKGRRHRLKLQECYQYRYLLQTIDDGCFDRRDGIKDPDLYDGFTKALNILAVDKDTMDSLLNVIVAVLAVGNFHCETTTTAEGDVVIERTSKNMQCLQHVADLLEVPHGVLVTSLSTRTITAAGETFVVTMDSENITTMRNMFAKSLYNTIFEWMISLLNTKLNPSVDDVYVEELASIGLLDMFGFEDLAHNSLEQLLINYTNEHLQQQFDFMMIESEQAFYIREGIEWSFIEFPSAQPCLDLVYSRNTSIVGALNDACRAPGGSDASFISQVYQTLGDHKCLSATKLDRGKSLFGVYHYAGLVKYECTNFVSKNKVISFPLHSLLKDSSSEFVKELIEFTRGGSETDLSPTRRGSNVEKKKVRKAFLASSQQNQTQNIVADTVADSFCQNVSDLLEKISMTTSNYVKCFKPNSIQTKQNFVAQYVKDQLKYSGILHSLQVMRIGFPIRYSFVEFWDKYYPLILSLSREKFNLSPQDWMKFVQALRNCDEVIIRQAASAVIDRLTEIESSGGLIVPPDFDTGCHGKCIQSGKSVVFLRFSGHFTLQEMMTNVVGKFATIIQTRQRRNVHLRNYQIKCRLIVNLQRLGANFVRQRRTRKLRKVLCRFVKKVTKNLVAKRLATMIMRAYGRLRVWRHWVKVKSTMTRFIAFCRARRYRLKYGDRCNQLYDVMCAFRLMKLQQKVVDSFAKLRDFNSTNYDHYIPNKAGVEMAFKGIIEKLQAAWVWKSKNFYALHAEAQVSKVCMTKEAKMYVVKQRDAVLQFTPQFTSESLLGRELIGANRQALWALYFNYVNMAALSSSSFNTIEQTDKYNVNALPMKYLFTLMKDWELSPYIVNQTAISSVVQFLKKAKYFFMDFDEEVWGRRYPVASTTNTPRVFLRSSSNLTPRHVVTANHDGCGDGGDECISFNIFCQLLLHIAGSLHGEIGFSKTVIECASSPMTILSVTMKDLVQVRFRDSHQVGLNLRLILTIMDRSKARIKLGNERNTVSVPPLVGVVGASETVSQKKASNNRKSSPVKQRKEILNQSPGSVVLTVMKINRPQLLLLALHYSRFNPSAHPGVLSEKEKIAEVHLTAEDMWNLATDFGICPHHCSKTLLVDICNLVGAGSTLPAESSSPSARPQLYVRTSSCDVLLSGRRSSVSPSNRRSSASPSRLFLSPSGPRTSSSHGGRVSSPTRQSRQSTPLGKKDYLNYSDFVRALFCLSLNIMSKRIEFMSKDFYESQFSPLLHMMNLSSGREKIASARRITTIVPPFKLSSNMMAEGSPSSRPVSPNSRMRRSQSLEYTNSRQLSPSRSNSRHSLSPSKSFQSCSPKVYNQVTPAPIGAAKSRNRFLLDKNLPTTPELPDFQF